MVSLSMISSSSRDRTPFTFATPRPRPPRPLWKLAILLPNSCPTFGPQSAWQFRSRLPVPILHFFGRRTVYSPRLLHPKRVNSTQDFRMVPATGLEPVRCYSLEPESSASANSATRALWQCPFSHTDAPPQGGKHLRDEVGLRPVHPDATAF